MLVLLNLESKLTKVSLRMLKLDALIRKFVNESVTDGLAALVEQGHVPGVVNVRRSVQYLVHLFLLVKLLLLELVLNLHPGRHLVVRSLLVTDVKTAFVIKVDLPSR